MGWRLLYKAAFYLGQLIADLRISKQAAGHGAGRRSADGMRGYLERDVDLEDRRKLTIALTERGRDAARVQTAARAKVDAALTARAGTKDVERARRVLAVLIEIGRELDAKQQPVKGPS